MQNLAAHPCDVHGHHGAFPSQTAFSGFLPELQPLWSCSWGTGLAGTRSSGGSPVPPPSLPAAGGNGWEGAARAETSTFPPFLPRSLMPFSVEKKQICYLAKFATLGVGLELVFHCALTKPLTVSAPPACALPGKGQRRLNSADMAQGVELCTLAFLMASS